MFCTQCGQRTEAGDKFCWVCGAPINARRSEAPAAANSSTAGGAILNVSSTMEMRSKPTIPKNAAELAERSSEDAAALSAARAPEPVTTPQPSEPVQPPVAPVNPPEAIQPEARNEVARAIPQEDFSREEPFAPTPPAQQSLALGSLAPADIPLRRTPPPAKASPPASPAARPLPGSPQDPVYDSVGNVIDESGPPMELGPADIPTPSFGGYGFATAPPPRKSEAVRPVVTAPAPAPAAPYSGPRPAAVRRRSRLSLLEIIVIVLLLIGAAAAVWMLRSSLPAKSPPPAAAAAINVTISPSEAQVTAGKAFDFAATISGTTDTRVTWTVQENGDGGRVVTHGSKVGEGNVTATAVYIAPNQPGTYHLTVASEAAPQNSAVAEITVVKR